MSGYSDSNRRGFGCAEELRVVGAEQVRDDSDDQDFSEEDRERETMEFPLDTASKVAEVISSDARGLVTIPPPQDLSGDPLDSMRFFQQIDDETSGEAERIAACRERLKVVRSALSNRDFKPERSFLRSVFLMPFPAAEKAEAKMKVYAFDHDETSSPLDEISAELLALTSYKDVDTGGDLSRVERLNLIKALTEYFEDLLVAPYNEFPEDGEKVDLEVNYLNALEIVHRLDFELMLDRGIFPYFRVGGDVLVITSEQVGLFKQKITKYFLDKHRESRGQEALGSGAMVGAIRLKIKTVRADLAPVNATQNGLPKDKERKIAQVDYKVKKLQTICKDILLKINPEGAALDTLRSVVVVEELLKTEAINISEYIELFELNDETEARLLAKRVGTARVEINSMNLPSDIISSLISEFLTKKSPSVRTDIWEKMMRLEE